MGEKAIPVTIHAFAPVLACDGVHRVFSRLTIRSRYGPFTQILDGSCDRAIALDHFTDAVQAGVRRTPDYIASVDDFVNVKDGAGCSLTADSRGRYEMWSCAAEVRWTATYVDGATSRCSATYFGHISEQQTGIIESIESAKCNPLD